MPDASYYRNQADVFDRVADQCSVPELIPYYRKLARDYRVRADSGEEPAQGGTSGDGPQAEKPG